MELGFERMLERLVLTNFTQRTSQRIRRSSGTRVMTCSRSLDRSQVARYDLAVFFVLNLHEGERLRRALAFKVSPADVRF